MSRRARRAADRPPPAAATPAAAPAARHPALPSGLPAWIGPAAVAAVFAALATASWGRWADPFIDFGREIYIAWRLGEGEALYRDLAYFHGPLSPYLNALLLRIFGVSNWTLFAANLALLAGICALAYAGLRRLFGTLAAVLASIFLLAVFGFAQHLTVAGFNFVGPYSHEMSHDTVLALLALGGLVSWQRGGSGWRAAIVSGTAFGLLLLGKPEFVIAAAGALVVGLAAAARSGARSPSAAARLAGGFAAFAVLPPVIAAAALGRSLGDTRAAGAALVSPWRHLLRRDVRDLAFYRQGLGLDDPLGNLGSAALWALGIAAVVALGVALSRAAPDRRHWSADLPYLLLPGALLFALRHELAWSSFARPLPFVLAGAAVVQGIGIERTRRPGGRDDRAPARLAVTVFALLLLLKMALNTRWHQYGFALAMPGSVLAVAWLAGAAPERWVATSGARRLRLYLVSLVLGVLAVHLAISARSWSRQKTLFAQGGDSFVGDAQANFHRLVGERLRARTPPAATLAVVPEGVMVNYLNRRVNPTPYVNFMPPELLLFGEERILDAYRRTPPDFVLLTNRDARDYGLGMLGRDHGRALMAWIQEGYEPLDEIREPTSAGLYFSYGLLLRRRAGEAP